MSQFGTEPGTSGFNDLTKEYKKSPTIENYVRLRREYPEGEVEVSTTGGVEFLSAQEKDLRSQGLDPDVVIRLFDADLGAQAEISLLLLQKIIERDNLHKSGETHIVSRKKVVSDTLSNYLIGCALDGMSWTDNLEVTRELIVLIKQQLGTLTSQYEIDQERLNRRSQATWIAAQLLNQGKPPTYRNIGRVLGVQASTVMRWFPDGDFIAEAEKLASFIKEFLPDLLRLAGEPKTRRPRKEEADHVGKPQ
jgi:hypothetical protein